MTQESTTATTKKMELGKLESRDVYTDDGRKVGVLKGILVDTSEWTVPQLVIEVNKKVLEELNLEKPMLSTALNTDASFTKSIMDELNLRKPGAVVVNVPTTHVKNMSDVVQLSSDLASAGSIVTISEKK